jgi:hypothetical protein
LGVKFLAGIGIKVSFGVNFLRKWELILRMGVKFLEELGVMSSRDRK